MRIKIEYDSTLEEECERTSQRSVSLRLGLSQGAVWQMLQDGRQIFLREVDGELQYCEFKDYGETKSRARNTAQ